MGRELDDPDLSVTVTLPDGKRLDPISCADVFFVNSSTHSSAGRLCEDKEVDVLFVNPDHVATLEVRERSDA